MTAGAGATTIQASISKDGTHFFPLSQNDVAITADKSGTGLLKTVNFNLDATVTETVSIKFENTGTASCQLDDIKLMPLDAPAEGSFLIDWKAAPELKTTPDNGGSLNFAADNGSGAAPDSQTIEYAWIGDDCTFAFEKADADTWYTITQTDKGDGTGTLTIQPEIYMGTDADRSSTVTVSVIKNGKPVITHKITVTQLKTGATVYETFNTGIFTSSNKTGLTGSWNAYQAGRGVQLTSSKGNANWEKSDFTTAIKTVTIYASNNSSKGNGTATVSITDESGTTTQLLCESQTEAKITGCSTKSTAFVFSVPANDLFGTVKINVKASVNSVYFEYVVINE